MSLKCVISSFTSLKSFSLPLVLGWALCCRCGFVLPECFAAVSVAAVWIRARWQRRLTEGGACPQCPEDPVCPNWEDTTHAHRQVHTHTHRCDFFTYWIFSYLQERGRDQFPNQRKYQQSRQMNLQVHHVFILMPTKLHTHTHDVTHLGGILPEVEEWLSRECVWVYDFSTDCQWLYNIWL